MVAMTIVASTPSSSPSQEPSHGARVETEHLVLEWTEVPDTIEIAAVTSVATRLHGRIADLLGDRPDHKITIVLGGAAERPDGKREYPRVDSRGRVLLFRFRPQFESYLDALGHELVHAFRFANRFTSDGFFEEGLAEFIELRVNPSLAGFPWFDYPVSLVAGQWVAAGEDIPLPLLHEKHRQLNLGCRAQSYALRSAFFDWLGESRGDSLVLAAARAPSPGALTDYAKYFGKPLPALAGEWREALLATYLANPDADSLALSYRRDSPIRYQGVCAEGREF